MTSTRALAPQARRRIPREVVGCRCCRPSHDIRARGVPRLLRWLDLPGFGGCRMPARRRSCMVRLASGAPGGDPRSYGAGDRRGAGWGARAQGHRPRRRPADRRDAARVGPGLHPRLGGPRHNPAPRGGRREPARHPLPVRVPVRRHRPEHRAAGSATAVGCAAARVGPGSQHLHRR